MCLQALSKRIHYGKYVAEAKFQETPELYEPTIRAKDPHWLMRLLTFEKVEKKVLERVEEKATVFGQEVRVGGGTTSNENAVPPVYKIQPSLVADLYGTWIMPLTKEVQVQYLLQRIIPLGEPPSPRAAHVATDVGTMVVIQGSKAYAEQKLEAETESQSSEPALISRLTEEKNSIVQQNSKLLQELESLRQEVSKKQNGFPIVIVVVVPLLGILLGYILKI